jgi:hypothetical protein
MKDKEERQGKWERADLISNKSRAELEYVGG